jgi:hypothetical protein
MISDPNRLILVTDGGATGRECPMHCSCGLLGLPSSGEARGETVL